MELSLSRILALAATCGVLGCGGASDAGGPVDVNATGGNKPDSVGGSGSGGFTRGQEGGTTGALGGQSALGGFGGNAGGGGAGTGGSSEEPWVVVENGAECSPIAARGCSTESLVSQMVCSAGNVWQWQSDCSAGTVCDPRPGLKVGQCVAPDQGCGVQPGVVCDDTYGALSTCVSPGFVSSTEQCLSGACADATSCQPWDPCDDTWIENDVGLSLDCTGLCGRSVAWECATPSRDSTAGRTFYTDCDYPSTAAVPPAVLLPTVAACADVHVFWLVSVANGCGETFDVHLPAPYSMKVVSYAEAVADQAAAESSVCNVGAGYVSATKFTPSADEAAIIFTTDADAPGFKLIID